MIGNIPFGWNGILGVWSGRNAATDKTPKTTSVLYLRDYPLVRLRLVIHHFELLAGCYEKKQRVTTNSSSMMYS